MKLSFISLALLALAGCIQGTASDQISTHQVLSFDVPTITSTPGITCDQGGPVFTTSTQTTFDLSDYFTQLQKQGTLTVQFNDNSLTGDLSSFRHADLYISHAGSSQSFLLSQTDFTPVNGKVELPIVMPSDGLVVLLAGGAVDLQTILSSCLPASSSGIVSINYTLGADISLSVNKGL